MARNGAGTYSLPAGNPVTTGTTISSTWANNTLNDIGSALTASLAYDGQTIPVANLPMGAYAHTNVGNATVRTMYAAAGQVQDGTFQYLTSVSGTNTITATAALSMSAYVAGQTFKFIAAATNTGAVTLNINGIGAKAITKNGTTALVAGDILINSVIEVMYDGTQFQISSVANTSFVSSFTAGTTGLTPSTATTGAVTLAGTLNVANGGTGVTTSTGTGAGVHAVSPVLTTPDLGTPSAAVLTNATGTANSLNAGIGVNQTWSLPTRVSGTSYTNSTGKPIQVLVTIGQTLAGSGTTTIVVGGVTIVNSSYGSNATGSNQPISFSFIVPNSTSYTVTTTSGASISVWAELR